MQRFIVLLTVMLSSIGFSYADCTFRVVNDSAVPLTVEAGFFGSESTVSFSVEPAMAKDMPLKNDKSCNAITKAGLGSTYMNLVGGQSSGGWVYDPVNKQIKAVGLKADATSAIGMGANGKTVTLLTNRRPDVDKFIVSIRANRSTSRQSSSMD